MSASPLHSVPRSWLLGALLCWGCASTPILEPDPSLRAEQASIPRPAPVPRFEPTPRSEQPFSPCADDAVRATDDLNIPQDARFAVGLTSAHPRGYEGRAFVVRAGPVQATAMRAVYGRTSSSGSTQNGLVLIPAGARLFGTASIDGARVQLQFNWLEIPGQGTRPFCGIAFETGTRQSGLPKNSPELIEELGISQSAPGTAVVNNATISVDVHGTLIDAPERTNHDADGFAGAEPHSLDLSEPSTQEKPGSFDEACRLFSIKGRSLRDRLEMSRKYEGVLIQWRAVVESIEPNSGNPDRARVRVEACSKALSEKKCPHVTFSVYFKSKYEDRLFDLKPGDVIAFSGQLHVTDFALPSLDCQLMDVSDADLF